MGFRCYHATDHFGPRLAPSCPPKPHQGSLGVMWADSRPSTEARCGAAAPLAALAITSSTLAVAVTNRTSTSTITTSPTSTNSPTSTTSTTSPTSTTGSRGALSSDAKTRGTLQKRDQAKTGAGMPEVKPITMLEEKILATIGNSTGTEEVLENDSVEVSESTEVILTLMDSECDSRTLPTARIIPSPAKKKKHISLQEELLELEKEKLLVMREK
ncbi:unnamed protein product [Arctogadus glacialis]